MDAANNICKGIPAVFFADKPYVSEFFKNTVQESGIPVVGTEMAGEMNLHAGTNLISEDQAVDLAREPGVLRLYATSENSIGWVSENLAFTGIPEIISVFKNKVQFRNLTQSLYPDFKFMEVMPDELKELPLDELPMPFIIKPTVGFFSMGVHVVSSADEWDATVSAISVEMEKVKNLYPREVLDSNSFIIEQFIEGEEYAFDVYFDDGGEPVVLSILKHMFSSADDVSDRVYITSSEIIKKNLVEFTEFAGEIGRLVGVKNFPVHIELRRDSQGVLLPIEVNPMRFGGWCTTADISFLAFGINPYLLYYNQEKPDWTVALEGKEGKIFSVIVLDNSTGLDINEIAAFDYRKLLATFENPLEVRQLDYQKYSVFGFLFAETSESNFGELKTILESDLTDYIIRK